MCWFAQEPWILGVLAAQAALLAAILIFRRHQGFIFTVFLTAGAQAAGVLSSLLRRNEV